VGRTFPLYCATSGRALLFDVQRDDPAALPADARFGQLGPNAPRMFDELHERVAGAGLVVTPWSTRSSSQGWSALPRRCATSGGRVCAAISLSAPKFRLGGRGRMNVVGKTIKTAADESSMLLGEAGKIDKRDTAGNER